MARHQGNHAGYTDAVHDALNKIDLNNSNADIANQISQIQQQARKSKGV